MGVEVIERSGGGKGVHCPRQDRLQAAAATAAASAAAWPSLAVAAAARAPAAAAAASAAAATRDPFKHRLYASTADSPFSPPSPGGRVATGENSPLGGREEEGESQAS